MFEILDDDDVNGRRLHGYTINIHLDSHETSFIIYLKSDFSFLMLITFEPP